MTFQTIIARSPYRLTLSGGGSDLAKFSDKYGGALINFTANKYMYVVIHKPFENVFRLRYSQTEEVESVNQIKHELIREVLRFLNITEGLEISTLSDISSRGTGLGSSSVLIVTLLSALHTYKGEYASPEQLAKEAYIIEHDILKHSVGRQDMWAAAYGGLRYYQFMQNGTVKATPIISNHEDKLKLKSHFMLLYTNIQREAEPILKSMSQVDNTSALLKRKELAELYYRICWLGNGKPRQNT